MLQTISPEKDGLARSHDSLPLIGGWFLAPLPREREMSRSVAARYSEGDRLWSDGDKGTLTKICFSLGCKENQCEIAPHFFLSVASRFPQVPGARCIMAMSSSSLRVIGIEDDFFVGEAPGFGGSIKSRAADFVVRDCNTAGVVGPIELAYRGTYM